MSTAVSDIYTDASHMILEGTSMTLAYSEANFLADLLVAVRTILQESGLIQNVFTVSGTSGLGRYTLPDAVGEVIAVIWNNSYLFPATGMAMNEDDAKWEARSRQPEVWNMDALIPDTIQISPLPTANGTLAIVATEQPTAASLALGDNVPLLPDSLTPYLVFAVLQKIWETDGEARDLNRAKYCKARLDELRNIARAVIDEQFAEVI